MDPEKFSTPAKNGTRVREPCTTTPSKPLERWLSPLSVAALFLALLCWTWRKWPDPIIDFGQQLYNGWQLSGGKLLYRDIDWAFGPLSQYVVAAWFRLTGVSLMSLVWLNLFILAAIVVMINRLVSAIAGRTAATAAGLVFVGVFAFGQYLDVSNYNYVTPYTEDATHGMAISLAGLLLLWRHGRTGDRRSLAGVGVSLGLLFLNKPEFFISMLAGVVAGLAGLLWAHRSGAPEWIRAGIVLIGTATLPAGAAWLFLASRMGPEGALTALAAPWETLSRSSVVGGQLYQAALGFSDVAGNLREMLKMLGWHAAVVAPAILIARRCRPGAAAFLIGLGTGGAGAVLLWIVVPPVSWLDVAAPFPLEVAGIAIWAGWRLHQSRGGGDEGPAATCLAVAVFALALLGKIALSTQVSQFGFVLAMPATVLLVSALMGWVPSRLDEGGGAGVAFRCIMGLLLACFVAAHWRIERDFMAAKGYPVGEGADRFWADSRGKNIDAAVAAVRSLSAEDARLFVMPEGTIINYLARRENPASLFGCVPNGFVEESAVVRMLRESRPELIVITDRPVQEFGVAPLGFGYGRQIMALVNRDYRRGRQIGPSPLMPGGSGIAVMVRNDYRP